MTPLAGDTEADCVGTRPRGQPGSRAMRWSAGSGGPRPSSTREARTYSVCYVSAPGCRGQEHVRKIILHIRALLQERGTHNKHALGNPQATGPRNGQQ